MNFRGQPFESVTSALSWRIVEFGPLAVGASLADLLGGRNQIGEFDKFCVELLDGLGGGGRVHHVFLKLLQFFGVVFIFVEVARSR